MKNIVFHEFWTIFAATQIDDVVHMLLQDFEDYKIFRFPHFNILINFKYEQVKREIKRIHISGYRCIERLKLMDLRVSQTLGCVGTWNT